MDLVVFIATNALFFLGVSCDIQITIYPEYLSQGGRTHYETKRWNGHNGLDRPNAIAKLRDIGTKSARWLNMDSAFQHVPEDPHRHGYPDPNYFKNTGHFSGLFDLYLQDFLGYHNDTCMVVDTNGKFWPKWIDKSLHNGVFPNNLDSASEFIVLLLKSLKEYTKGVLPQYFEVINEPGVYWRDISWQTIIDYHKLVVQKLKANFPVMQVGGPTRNGVVAVSDYNDFREWRLTSSFLDMSLDKLDFFSFHVYNNLNKDGNNYRWSGASESRIVAFLDLVENYAHNKKGHGIPLIVSEFGGFDGHGIDSSKPEPLIDWIHIYGHNSQILTYLTFRGVVEQAIGFFLQHDTYEGQSSLHNSLLASDGSELSGAKTYRFWKQFNYDYQFLRIDNPFDNNERKVSSLALANSKTGQVSVILHSYDMHHSQAVKLTFANRWMTTTQALTTCLNLNANKEPVLTKGSLHVQNGIFTLPSQSTCIVTFHTSYNLHSLPTITETTYYGRDTVKNIKKDCTVCIFSCVSCTNAISTHVNIHAKGTVEYATLRISVSLPGKTGGNPTPKTVLLINHQLTSHYQLHQTSRGYENTRWEVYLYRIPVNVLRQNDNEVKVEFDQASGYVSTVVVVVGRK